MTLISKIVTAYQEFTETEAVKALKKYALEKLKTHLNDDDVENKLNALAFTISDTTIEAYSSDALPLNKYNFLFEQFDDVIPDNSDAVLNLNIFKHDPNDPNSNPLFRMQLCLRTFFAFLEYAKQKPNKIQGMRIVFPHELAGTLLERFSKALVDYFKNPASAKLHRFELRFNNFQKLSTDATTALIEASKSKCVQLVNIQVSPQEIAAANLQTGHSKGAYELADDKIDDTKPLLGIDGLFLKRTPAAVVKHVKAGKN